MASLPARPPTLKRKASTLSRSPSPIPLPPAPGPSSSPSTLPLPPSSSSTSSPDGPPTPRPTKKPRLRLPTPPPDKARRPRATSQHHHHHRRAMSLPAAPSPTSARAPWRMYEEPPPARPVNPMSTALYSPEMGVSALVPEGEDSEYMEYAFADESERERERETSVPVVAEPQMRIPPLRPLTNTETVRQWDFTSLASNPQFRHDLLLDPDLPFVRPPPSYAQQILTEAYWLAISRELATGCTCMAFDPSSGLAQPCCCSGMGGIGMGRGMDSLMGLLTGPSLAIPARLPALVRECRAVLLSALCPPRNPAWLPPTKDGSPAAHEDLPSPARDPDEVLPSLPSPPYTDVDLPEYFRRLTGVIVQNCAPIRDEMVGRLMEGAERGDMVWVLRSLLDLGELMKMDLANFERPRLAEHFFKEAPSYEAHHLYTQLLAAHRSSRPQGQQPKTLRALMPNTHLWLSSLPSLPRSPRSAPAPWPRLAHALTHFLLSHALGTAPPPLPETLRLSHPFILSLSALLRDTFALALLFYHYRTLAHLPFPPPTTSKLPLARRRKPTLDYATLKSHILSVGPPRLGADSDPSPSSAAGYKDGVRSALLLVRTRADDARYPAAVQRHLRPVPSERDVLADERFFFSALRPSPTSASPLAQRARAFALSTLTRALSHSTLSALALPTQGQGQEEMDLRSLLSDAGAGMECVHGEMRELGRRMGRLVEVHGHVWRWVYEGEGWI